MSESLGIGRARQWLEEDPSRVYGSILPLSRDKAGGGLRLALPTAARDLGRGVLDMLEGHMTPEASMALLDVPTGGLMRAAAIGARVPATQLGIFAGVGAKTANKAALETAQRMAGEGADPRAIWRDTGWFQGPEGKWRWEIDDSGAVLDPSNYEYQSFQGASYRDAELPSVVTHRSLFDAYPNIKRSQVVKYDFENPRGVRGEYREPIEMSWGDPVPETVTLWGGRYAPEAGDRSTVLHELQHGVQQRENFARGGAVDSITGAELPDNPRHAKWLSGQSEVQWANDFYNSPKYELQRNEMNDYFANVVEPGLPGFDDPNYDEAWQRATDLLNERFPEMARFDQIAKEYGLNEPSRKIDPREAYRRLAGEAEARAVQKRMDMTPEQRRATFPLDSYDVPLDELIVRGAEVDPEFRRLWLQGKAT